MRSPSGGQIGCKHARPEIGRRSGDVYADNIKHAGDDYPRFCFPIATIASVNARPTHTASREESVALFVSTIERVVPAKVDLILLPEGITVVGTNQRFAQVAENIPGPTTERLGEVARAHQSDIVAGMSATGA